MHESNRQTYIGTSCENFCGFVVLLYYATRSLLYLLNNLALLILCKNQDMSAI